MVVLDILAGVFMGILTGMGIGGGGLLVLYLTMVDKMGQLAAQGCNLLFFVFSSAASLYVHNRKRRLDFRLIGTSAALAIIGSRVGVGLTSVFPEGVVRSMYGWMLIIAGSITAVRLLFKK